LCESLGPRLGDRLANIQILSISIYLESNDIPTFPFGKRATIYPGVAPLSEIFLEEVLGRYIKKPEVDTIEHGTKTSELQNLKTNVEDVEDIHLLVDGGSISGQEQLISKTEKWEDLCL
jgi:hypothetical protein